MSEPSQRDIWASRYWATQNLPRTLTPLEIIWLSEELARFRAEARAEEAGSLQGTNVC